MLFTWSQSVVNLVQIDLPSVLDIICGDTPATVPTCGEDMKTSGDRVRNNFEDTYYGLPLQSNDEFHSEFDIQETPSDSEQSSFVIYHCIIKEIVIKSRILPPARHKDGKTNENGPRRKSAIKVFHDVKTNEDGVLKNCQDSY